MIGAIAGDIIGSVYELTPIKRKEFPLFSKHCIFTDDTVLTVALADSILNDQPYLNKLKEYYRAYPWAGYGGHFESWANSASTKPYNSWGNGSAMRVSPVGFAYDDLETVLAKAKQSAEVTHNHPEGIKGAQATAAAIFLARTGQKKAAIKEHIENRFGIRSKQPFRSNQTRLFF
jgi:ADP-ribosylglycohydrolase